MVISFIGLTLLVMGIFPLVNLDYFNPLKTQITSPMANILWDLVNNWRIESKLRPFKRDNRLCILAKIRVKEILSDFGHDGFNKKFMGNTFKNDGYWKYSKLGENLAKFVTDEDVILNMWLNSASHAANLKDNYLYSCIECESGYCVQMFGKKYFSSW